MRIRKGDTVKIMKGKDNGKTGAVLRVDIKEDKVVVEGLNRYKKHVKPRKQGEKGQVVEIARPIQSANVRLICPFCNKPVRVGFETKDGKKMRYCKKCKNFLEK